MADFDPLGFDTLHFSDCIPEEVCCHELFPECFEEEERLNGGGHNHQAPLDAIFTEEGLQVYPNFPYNPFYKEIETKKSSGKNWGVHPDSLNHLSPFLNGL